MNSSPFPCTPTIDTTVDKGICLNNLSNYLAAHNTLAVLLCSSLYTIRFLKALQIAVTEFL
jgi:2-keto-3-deoxy-6-phosphogluconate aldolase